MLNNKVTRTAFLISFIGHCLFLGIPNINLNLPCETKKPEGIAVNIEIEKPSLLPKIDVMGEEKKLKEVMEELKPLLEEVVIEEPPEKTIEEKIKVINPSQEAMLRYQDMVKQRIEEVRSYPSRAKRQGIEGTVYLSFTILFNGLSQDIKIIRSSGSKILDEEVVATIKRANPFPPIPEKINSSSAHMEVAIVFSLK